jgi:O-antigen/teichoic acid export membrane protein
VAATLANTLVAGLQGMQRMGRIAAAAAAGVIVANALGLIVLFRHGSVVLYALAGTAAAWVPLIANFTKFWPYLRGNLHADLVICKRIVRGGLPFLMMSAVLTVYGLIDIPILEAVAGSKTVGWYALAYRWVGLPVVFASIVGTAVFPSLSARFEEQSDTFTDQANKAIRLVYFAGAPIATGLILVAPDMLRLLYPNTSFSSAVPVMQILAVHLPIVTITMMLAAVLVASDRQNSWVVVGCIAGAINITLNLIAIPLSIRVVHNGAIGASIVTVLTEAFVFAGALRLRPRGVFDTSTRNSLLRCTGACLAMAPPVLALHSAALPLKVGAGVVTFAAASFLLHVVTMDELRSMFSKGLRAPSPTT